MLTAVLITACFPLNSKPHPEGFGLKADSPFVLVSVSGLTQVSQLTGATSDNKTDQYDVFGTDLGSMINFKDRTYFVFGDTFGYRSESQTGAGGSDWRSNVIGVSTDTDPADGITLDRMITDYGSHAKEVIPSEKINFSEMTTIPTHGVAAGDNLYLYYMSVNYWGMPGEWYANYSGVSKSTDEGETWEIIEGLRWPGDSNFIQVSPYTVKINEEMSEIYFWGIPAGRFGGVQLMKVNEAEIEVLEAYRYYAGLDGDGEPIWSASLDDAAMVLEDILGVGELSVIWNPYLERWIMTYLSGPDIVIREGISPWGPWGEAIMLVDHTEYPSLYSPYLNPKFMEDDGRTIYFTMSLWGPYNVFWMKATLNKAL